jgi:hypothetical protein
MPQRIRDFGVAVVALVAVFAALSAMDARVPGRLSQALADAGNGELTAPGTALGDLAMALAASPAAGNVIVAAFVGAALVLTLLMIRT